MSGTNQESFDKLKIRLLFVIVLAMGAVMAGHYFGYFLTEHKSDEVILAELEAQQYEMSMFGRGGSVEGEDGADTAEYDNGFSQGFDDGYMQGYNDASMSLQPVDETAMEEPVKPE